MKNQNKKDDKFMTDKQKNYIEGLLSDKRISNKYEDYRQYVKQVLQSDCVMTLQHASNIIENLKNIIEFNEAMQKCRSGNDNSSDNISNENIVTEHIE